ncbi:MAG: phosphomethylpyrimidine synthase ThiC [Verrucomicrobiota bacterium]
MTTQFEKAVSGNITIAMRAAADRESANEDGICAEIARGRAVLPFNPTHSPGQCTVVGRDFSTKVNANIGYSSPGCPVEEELRKLKVALDAGADFVMDLSVGSGLAEVRRRILEACPVPLGTVPIYEAMSVANGQVGKLSPALMLDVIRQQAKEGVDFMTIHAGLLKKHVPLALKRKLGIVSRGGSILAEYMTEHDRENPFYTAWDEILDICRNHDVTISLGDGLRPGCLADASDAAQFAELETLGELVGSCRQAGVQVMVEGPGHVPFDQIEMNVRKQQEVCSQAPFYVLGPVVTDVAPGYDHITSSIGATAAAYYGASLLCYVTPAEHLGLPTDEDVRQGVMAYRIAAHSADVAKGLPGAREWDDRMADARREFDWNRQFEIALDGQHAKEKRGSVRGSDTEDTHYCSMCGHDFCAVRISRKIAAREEKGPAQ